MIAGVLCDMDGTLVDSEPLYFRLNLAFLARHGVRVDAADFARYVGASARAMWAELKARHDLPQSIDELMARERRDFAAALADGPALPPLPGVADLLAALRARGLPLGIASSSPRANVELVLRRSDLAPFFKALTTGEDVARGKPAPDIFLLGAQRLGVAPAATLVIEDSRNGTLGARAAGMTVVGLRNPHSGEQDLAAADLVVDDFGPAARARILGLLVAPGGGARRD